jgi:hypothetical protein
MERPGRPIPRVPPPGGRPRLDGHARRRAIPAKSPRPGALQDTAQACRSVRGESYGRSLAGAQRIHRTYSSWCQLHRCPARACSASARVTFRQMTSMVNRHVSVHRSRSSRTKMWSSCLAVLARGRAARFPPPVGRVAATHGGRRRVKGGRTAGPKDPSPLRRRRVAVGSAGRPRERPVRGRVQGPGRGAGGEAVPGRPAQRDLA